MTRGLAVVIGMSIAYIASFAGMIFAYIYYKKSLNNLVLLLFLSIKKDKEAIIFPRVWELLERAVM